MYETVVRAGEQSGLHTWSFFSSFSLWDYIIYIGIFIVLNLLFIFLLEWLEGIAGVALLLTWFMMIAVLPFLKVSDISYEAEKLNNKEISEYKQEYGNPYIYQLPIIKAEVFYMKIDTNAEVTGNIILGSGSINSELATTLTLSYKLNGQGITETIKTIPNFDLSSGDKPYVTYQELIQDLPYYEQGKYNFQFHLPEDYSFTDIK